MKGGKVGSLDFMYDTVLYYLNNFSLCMDMYDNDFCKISIF